MPSAAVQILQERAQLTSDSAHASRYLEEFVEKFRRNGVVDKDIMALRLAMEEVLMNAIKHGNLEDQVSPEQQSPPEERRRRIVDVSLGMEEVETFLAPKRRGDTTELVPVNSVVRIVVQDQGRGFDLEQVEDPTEGGNIERASGRGLKLIRHFMDHCSISPTAQGTRVEMINTLFRNAIQEGLNGTHFP